MGYAGELSSFYYILTWTGGERMTHKVGNIGEEQYLKCLEYFRMYWELFSERNPKVDTDEWRDHYFMVFHVSSFVLGEGSSGR